MIDKSEAGIRTVITGAMLRFIRSTIARKTSGAKVLMGPYSKRPMAHGSAGHGHGRENDT